MPVTDADLFGIINRLGDHYKTNIYNRYLRKALMNLQVDRTSWEYIEDLIEISDYRKIQGFTFHELYERILSIALFTAEAREKIAPNIKNIVGTGYETVFSKEGSSDRDNILRNMAVNNFSANLGVLSDMIHELYLKTIDLDKKGHKNKRPVYTRLPELEKLGKLLITM